MPILEEIQAAIENGRPKDAERLISRAVEEGIRPSVILEEAMITAMRNAGEYYRNNDGDIPRILAAARSMRKGLNILEPYLEKDKVCFLGTVLLGTIEGDLHDVGKNLVAMMFRSAGFHVIDLGVDVSEKQFLKAVQDNPQVQIVCISSLLTTSMPEMRRVVKSLRESGPPNLKIMVGGGSVTQEFADEIGADAYTETAVDAAEVAKKFTN
ncbi:corrinoid protein [Cuneatibacter sp. NSJ-177]|jgi:methylmalonyl-CoA mutase cobalamin-binding domain/chain|uniref:cobalamin B12-binding domain-containing protein n=1 Tax=Cuneatibacter sp. NSJ-177 TaxID=2931401 RepID=UPI001FD2A89B|nr:corrinoid protein [Cuneatibacter sp. NSJ-177]MCJ7835028.1 corrinoid protein [Cuneatibacter sp. NSJ-177]